MHAHAHTSPPLHLQPSQDREIQFDIPIRQLELRKGERTLDMLDTVEDTKGNNGERGDLIITNLRLIWWSHRSRRTNLSVGYNAIISINIRQATSRLRGPTQALYVLTKYNGSRFEFIFTNLVRNSPRLFTTIQAVFRAYDTTRLYRDLKLRGAIIQDNELKLLPREQIYSKLQGVCPLPQFKTDSIFNHQNTTTSSARTHIPYPTQPQVSLNEQCH